MLSLCLVLLRPPRACSHGSKFYCFVFPSRVPRLLTGHRLPQPTSRPPSRTTALWAPPQPPGGLEYRLQKFPSIQRKPCLWEIFFSVIRRPEGSPNQWKLTEQIKTQDPQRAPRTPGVRSQALHLCANGAGLGIRDYQSPELRAAVRSLCPEGSGRFLAPLPPLLHGAVRGRR